MNLEELEARIRTLESIEEIKKLQRCYGYFMEHGMLEEIVDLFSDNPEGGLWHAGAGMFKGKAGARKFFEIMFRDSENRESLTQMPQVSGIVDIDPDGKMAKGRWSAMGTLAVPHRKGVSQTNMSVIYENDYIQENGKWKIKILRVYEIWEYNPKEGFVKPGRLASPDSPADIIPYPPKADIPDHTHAFYPSGYIVPFHFKHPVTGKDTSAGARNSRSQQSK